MNRYVQGRWLNPGDLLWKKPYIKRHLVRGGSNWICPNHPERRHGGISGQPGSGMKKTLRQCLAALSLHLYLYHGLELTYDELGKIQRTALWYNKSGLRRNEFLVPG